MDREIKRVARKAKRTLWRKFLLDLEYSKCSQTIGRISDIMKAQNNNARRCSASPSADLDLNQFTDFVASRFPRPIDDNDVIPKKFHFGEHFKNRIKKALKVMKDGKAVGKDGVFSEALKIKEAEMGELICNVWKVCGTLGAMPDLWHAMQLYPIHKKGSRSIAENYRPVALLSHMRKVIEKEIDYEVRSITNMSPLQCGFRAGRGVEQPILRFLDAARHGHNHIAVLDLKGAYPSVPRGKLMKVLEKRLPQTITDMISVLLTPDKVETVGDDRQIRRQLAMGVPEGSPLSPTMFNLYADTLAYLLTSMPKTISLWPSNLYADDIQLLALSAEGLQMQLDVCTGWGREYNLIGAPSKSTVLTPRSTEPDYFLAGRPLPRKRQTTYLGVQIS